MDSYQPSGKCGPITLEQARVVRQAFRDHGRVSRHPAKLNFGDRFSDAPMRAKREPILYKGREFARTDLAARSLRIGQTVVSR